MPRFLNGDSIMGKLTEKIIDEITRNVKRTWLPNLGCNLQMGVSAGIEMCINVAKETCSFGDSITLFIRFRL